MAASLNVWGSALASSGGTDPVPARRPRRGGIPVLAGGERSPGLALSPRRLDDCGPAYSSIRSRF